MTLQDILKWLSHNLWSIILGLSVFIQITPIKINPWSTLFKWIGNWINADTRKDITEIKTIVTNQQNTIDENEKDRIRWEILDFANSCRNGRRHTKDEYQHIITLRDKYNNLLEKTGEKNGVFEAEYQYILELYAERQRKNDFL